MKVNLQKKITKVFIKYKKRYMASSTMQGKCQSCVCSFFPVAKCLPVFIGIDFYDSRARTNVKIRNVDDGVVLIFLFFISFFIKSTKIWSVHVHYVSG